LSYLSCLVLSSLGANNVLRTPAGFARVWSFDLGLFPMADNLMAESAAQRNARLRAKRKEAMARADGGVREDAAVEKTVAPATPPTVLTKETEAPKPLKPLTTGPNRVQKQPGSNKVYTKHVVFALVSAIVIQLVALNKSLPTKG
jgi:hypothetical protein